MKKILGLVIGLVLVAVAIVAIAQFKTGTSQPVANKSEVGENWKQYSSNNIGFSIKYDSSLIVSEEENNTVRLYKYGPTQRGQTEMYDGIILTVRRVSLTNSAQSYIDAQMEGFKNDGTITVPLHDEKLNGISVKAFSGSGLGDFNLMFVPVNDQTLLEISYMAPDPTNAGFQKTVEMMLSTFQLK